MKTIFHSLEKTMQMRIDNPVLTGPPGLLFAICLAILLFARLAFSLDVEAVTRDGQRPPGGSLSEVFQENEIAIHNQVAAAKHSFQFKSLCRERLELTCNFLLATGELVDGFAYWNGAEKIVGEVLEKQTAAEVYQELTGVNRDPGLLEQVGERFRFRVFPVEPDELKPVEVRTVIPLEVREGVVEYSIPGQNLPKDGAVLSIKADITDDLPIEKVEAVGFNGIVKRLGPHSVRVLYEGEVDGKVGDMKIRYRLASQDHALRFMAHRDENRDGTFMLLISPKDLVEENDVIGRDIVFIIDRSGSMQGEPLSQTKQALAYIIGELSDQDRFDIINFDDEIEPLFGSLFRIDKQTREKALEHVLGLESRGGTNILDALMAGLDELEKAGGGRPKAIVFLTDGQGSNPPEVVLAKVRGRGGSIRIFGFGAGDGVNKRFLDRLSRDNRGISVFVRSSAQINEEMRRLYDRIAIPLMVDLDVRFEGMKTTAVYPKRLPDLYRDGQVAVLGRFDGSSKGRIVVTGKVRGREKILATNVTLPENENGFGYVEKLWAAKRIESLTDSVYTRESGVEELEKEITRLGIVYNLVTDYTTFLAVPESLKTKEIKEMIRSGKRGYDKKLVDSMEGIRLSMLNIPPGDPVLSVAAPADAGKVVAYFPFGLVKRMSWDPHREHWSVRFLVPRNEADGVYIAKVLIIHVDGAVEWREIEYTVDSQAPEFEATIPSEARPGGVVKVVVDPFEPVDEVYAWIPSAGSEKTLLSVDPDSGVYEAEIELPVEFADGPLEIRISVRDRARNKFERSFFVDAI